MDPVTGRIYSQDEIKDLPDDIKARIVPVEDREAFAAELAELKVLQRLYEEAQKPDEWLETPYTPNRAARRKQAKRDRALQKRDLRG